MAQRPAPKRSSFGASHPIEHREDQPLTDQLANDAQDFSQPAEPATLAAVPDVADVPSERRKPGPAPSGKVKKKAAVWADEEVIERIRGAWFHTPTTSGEREMSFSDFLLEAALARTAEREQKYNQGEEFPPVPAGRIGVGRKA